jgi:hypothetical protein
MGEAASAGASPREDVPYLPLLTGLAAWYLYRLAVEQVLKRWSPGFYHQLRGGNYEKYLYFLGMLLGLMVKPIPLFGCGLAVWQTPPEDDIAGFRRPMKPSQQLCWGSRTVIYISELPHFLHVPELFLHHLLTVLGMAVVAKFHISRRGIDLSFASLWSEIPFNFRYVLKLTGHLSPALDWHINFYGTLFLFVTRVPTTIVAIAMIPASGLQAGPALVFAMAYLFHLAYIVRISYMRMKKCGVLQVENSGVFRVQVGDRLKVTSTTLLTSLSLLATQVSFVLLYSWSTTGGQPVGKSQLTNLMWNSALARIVGLVGSRLIAGFPQLFGGTIWVSLLYHQCDLLIAAIVLARAPFLETSLHGMEYVDVFYCLALSSSLSKATHQYAFHLARLQTDSEQAASPKSLNRSIINIGQYLIFAFAVASGYLSLESAAVTSLLVQWAVEFAANSAVTKANTFASLASLVGLMTAWRISLAKISGNMYHFELFDNQTIDSLVFGQGTSSPPYWVKFLLQDASVAGGFYMFFSATIDYLCGFDWNKARIPGAPKMRTMGLLTVTGWLCYIVFLVFQGQAPEQSNKSYTAAQILAREPPMCSLLLSWSFWAALSSLAVVSTVLGHMWGPELQLKAVVDHQETSESEALVVLETKDQ